MKPTHEWFGSWRINNLDEGDSYVLCLCIRNIVKNNGLACKTLQCLSKEDKTPNNFLGFKWSTVKTYHELTVCVQGDSAEKCNEIGNKVELLLCSSKQNIRAYAYSMI